jgi:hypothetical protein
MCQEWVALLFDHPVLTSLASESRQNSEDVQGNLTDMNEKYEHIYSVERSKNKIGKVHSVEFTKVPNVFLRHFDGCDNKQCVWVLTDGCMDSFIATHRWQPIGWSM